MNPTTKRRRSRGFVLVIMSLAATALAGALGMAVDFGRMYITKNELQVFCDAASLAAAVKLDGTTNGISNATQAVSTSVNGWNFGTTLVSGYQLDFATSVSGPWSGSPSPATNYLYARVQVTTPMQLYFLPMVTSNQFTQNVYARSIGAQIPITSFVRGLGPFSAVSPDPTAVNYGLQIGSQYDIQWPQYNGSRSGCGPSNPDKCFNQPTCANESNTSKTLAVSNWGASVNGYWGANANSTINAEVLDLVQLQPVAIGQSITMSSGNKAAEATALDTRVNQDGDVVDNDVNVYAASSTKNGRRYIGLPILTPTPGGTATVVGYGAFLLISNGVGSNYYRSMNGNDPFCAIYAGPYVQGGGNPGGNSSGGAYKVSLVQ